MQVLSAHCATQKEGSDEKELHDLVVHGGRDDPSSPKGRGSGAQVLSKKRKKKKHEAAQNPLH